MPTRFNSDKPNGSDTPLDLGLGALLGGDSPPSETNQEIPTAPKSELEVQSPYQGLADRGAWLELGSLAEEHLPATASHSDGANVLEARLWWILSQLKTNAVPLAMLVAPLEWAVAGVVRLCETQPDGSGRALRSLAKEVVEVCVAKLPTDSDDQLAGTVRGLYTLLAGKPASHHGANATVLTSSMRPPVPGAVASELPKQAPLRTVRFLAGLIILAALSWWVWNSRDKASQSAEWDQHGNSSQQQNPHPVNLAELPPAAMPQLPASKLIDQVSQLDAVYYEMQQSASPLQSFRRDTENKVTNSSSSVASAPEPTNQEPGTGVVQSAAASSAPRAVVDTSGPLEPKDFPRTEEESSEPSESNDRDRDNSTAQRSSRDSQSDLGGRVAESPRFEEYARLRYYRIIVETDVMENPSFRSRVMDRLKPGVEIRVEGKEGYWLRVRSSRGNVGYVFDQDAERQRDW